MLTFGDTPSESSGDRFGFGEPSSERGAASVVIPLLEGEARFGHILDRVLVTDILVFDVYLVFAEMKKKMDGVLRCDKMQNDLMSCVIRPPDPYLEENSSR